MTTIQTCLSRCRQLLRQWTVEPGFHTALRISGHLLAGFLLSASSLKHTAQPIVLGLVCATAGWPAVLICLGGVCGYLLFWGSSGTQGLLWLAAGAGAVLLLGERRITRTTPMLMSAVSGLIVALSGLAFQNWASDETSVPMYLLRIAMGLLSTGVFTAAIQKKDPIGRWLAMGLGVLALAQVAPFSWLCLGFAALGIFCVSEALPVAILAGLALDLAQIAQIPMTAAACLACFVRLFPQKKRWLSCCAPALSYLGVMALCGKWALYPLPPLLLGGLVGLVLPSRSTVHPRRGETGIAQVRLEMAASVFTQAQQLLLEAPGLPIDEAALIARGAERACGSCPCRKTCREREAALQMSPQLLHRPLLDGHDLPIACRKESRLLQELHRCQEQLRTLRAGREQQSEYRSAVLQQYRFVSDYLQDLSDLLGRRAAPAEPRFTPEVAVASNRREADNGDRCLWFSGTENQYYVLLCDGMGTGLGAVDEGRTAAQMLKKLLCAGFPAEHALRSINSLCALRSKAGCVTIDLAQLHLDSGKAVLYKWGAAPSYRLSRTGTEKIGTVGPPPGLSVTETRESVDRLSLRRGESLVLLSDGVGGEDALRCFVSTPGEPLGGLAERILECGNLTGTDDATVAVVRLSGNSLGA